MPAADAAVASEQFAGSVVAALLLLKFFSSLAIAHPRTSRPQHLNHPKTKTPAKASLAAIYNANPRYTYKASLSLSQAKKEQQQHHRQQQLTLGGLTIGFVLV